MHACNLCASMPQNVSLCFPGVDAVSVLLRSPRSASSCSPRVDHVNEKSPMTRQIMPCCTRRPFKIGLCADCKTANFRDSASSTFILIARSTASAGPLELSCPQTSLATATKPQYAHRYLKSSSTRFMPRSRVLPVTTLDFMRQRGRNACRQLACDYRPYFAGPSC